MVLFILRACGLAGRPYGAAMRFGSGNAGAGDILLRAWILGYVTGDWPGEMGETGERGDSTTGERSRSSSSSKAADSMDVVEPVEMRRLPGRELRMERRRDLG